MESMKVATHFLFLFTLLFVQDCLTGFGLPTTDNPTAGACLDRPATGEAPKFARWLVSHSSWGVLTTIDTNQVPFGNVISFTDEGTGIPLFYISTLLEKTGIYAVMNTRSSFTLSEFVLACSNSTEDPQSPFCAKITLQRNLRILNETTREAKSAEAALFRRHPTFLGFPKMKMFSVFTLDIGNIYLVNEAAPPRDLSVADYLGI